MCKDPRILGILVHMPEKLNALPRNKLRENINIIARIKINGTWESGERKISDT